MIPAVDVRSDPAREEAELREYLGDRYDQDHLWHYRERVDAEFAASSSEDHFYRSSQTYLYDLTVFAMSETKLPYVRELARHLPPGARVLDYGCGIGSDGLMLLEAGFEVEFADFNNPSTEYLRWRLGRRGLEAPVHDFDQGIPDGFYAAYAFDVIEHVRDPFGLLNEMEQRARLVEVNFLEPGPDEPELHYELPIRELLDHAARHRVRSYRVLHGRSHLVLYESDEAAAWERVLSRTRIGAVHARRRPVSALSSLRAH